MIRPVLASIVMPAGSVVKRVGGLRIARGQDLVSVAAVQDTGRYRGVEVMVGARSGWVNSWLT